MKLGVLLWPQYTDFASLRDTGTLVDRLGYDTLWTWDHVYPLVVKLVTTLDHISNGRMNLGIGGAWFETEHTAYGIEFGSGFGERLNWFDEAVGLMRNMLPGGPASARGKFYK